MESIWSGESIRSACVWEFLYPGAVINVGVEETHKQTHTHAKKKTGKREASACGRGPGLLRAPPSANRRTGLFPE